MSGRFIGILGAPGTGKSEFIASCAAHGKLFVACSPATEIDSYASNAATEHAEFDDERWRPSQGMYEATAYRELMKRMYALLENESVRYVGVDSASAVSDLVWHEVMKAYKTEDPTKIGGNSYGPYVDYRGHLIELLQVGRMLAAKGKDVLYTFHVSSREAEGIGVPRREGKGELAWDEQLLPDVRSSLRASVARFFSVWMYATPQFAGPNTRYRFSLVAQQGMPARVRGVKLDAKRATIDVTGKNGWAELMEALK